MDGCERVVQAKGLCDPHYYRLRKHGAPDALIKSMLVSPADRLRRLTKRSESGCLEWQGTTNKLGYGTVTANGKTMSAHKWAWEMAKGAVPDGMCLRHACDNPPCVDVEHLSVGTYAQNSQDMAARKRSTHGSRNPQSALTEAKVAEILELLKAGGRTQASIAREYGVVDSAITRIKKGYGWKHVERDAA